MTKESKKDGQNSVTPRITAFHALAEIKERAANWLVRIDSGDFSVADQQALTQKPTACTVTPYLSWPGSGIPWPSSPTCMSYFHFQ